MPTTANGLAAQVYDWENLVAAYQHARRGKRYKQDVLRFSQHWEEELIDIQNRLIWRTWEPSPFTVFPVFEPKHRIIEAPPFPDRVVHHALHRVVEPYFERRFIHDSFACRRGGGIHAAVRRLQRHLRAAQRRWGRVYVLQADIRRYFPSIRHDRLKRQIARTISDPWVNDLWGRIIDATGEDGVGQPIGALTSQLAANVYLDAFDHFVKDDLGEPHYLRYMDDFLLLGPDKAALWQQLDVLRERLAGDLGLLLSKAYVYPARQGVDWAGYRTWATHIRPRKSNVKTARRRLLALAAGYRAGRVHVDELRASAASFAGYVKHCQGLTAASHILADIEYAVGDAPLHVNLRDGDR